MASKISDWFLALSVNKLRFLIIVCAALLFIPFLGVVHLFDWDEINFAEAAREMIVTGDYLTVQINYQAFWEKPPLFIYLQAISIQLFGVSEFAARFPNAICGIATLLVLFNIGTKLRGKLFGILWVLAYAGSLLPFLYFKSGIIDPWFNLFIFLGVYYLMLYSRPEDLHKLRNIGLSAGFAGLAVMTKGPVGFLLIALTAAAYLLRVRFKVNVRIKEVILYFTVLILVGGFWFLIQILNGNYDIVVDFINYQIRLFRTEDASHGGFFGYHFVVLLIGVFPSSILALKSFRKEGLSACDYALMKTWMLILFWVVIILFSIVKTKILHYSSLAYFPISFLAANYISNCKSNGLLRWSKWQSVLTVFLAALIALPFLIVPFVDKIKSEVVARGLIQDDFVIGNLQADGNWGGYEYIPAVIFLALTCATLFFVSAKEPVKRAIILWVVTLIFTFSILILVVPKIERYSQNALIEFFESVAEEDAYISTLNFKSYARYFYGNTKQEGGTKHYDQQWLLTGPIDKDVYFAAKPHDPKLLLKYPELEKIKEENGYVFYVRFKK